MQRHNSEPAETEFWTWMKVLEKNSPGLCVLMLCLLRTVFIICALHCCLHCQLGCWEEKHYWAVAADCFLRLTFCPSLQLKQIWNLKVEKLLSCKAVVWNRWFTRVHPWRTVGGKCCAWFWFSCSTAVLLWGIWMKWERRRKNRECYRVHSWVAGRAGGGFLFAR